MKILTCNIRCYGAKDGANSWVHRKDFCIELIKSHSADIICFQEMWAEQFQDVLAAFRDYEWFGMADEPIGKRPTNAIFYRTSDFERISSGGYWLSETPHVAGSGSWDTDCVRLANWIRLEHRQSGKEFRVVNTHLDHINQVARENQAKLIVADALAYPETYPQILTGDMNCDTTNLAIDIFKRGGWVDSYGAVHGTEDPGLTYHEFMGPDFVTDLGKIDWIFSKGALQVTGATVIADSRDGRFPSDHYFVSATFEL